MKTQDAVPAAPSHPASKLPSPIVRSAHPRPFADCRPRENAQDAHARSSAADARDFGTYELPIAIEERIDPFSERERKKSQIGVEKSKWRSLGELNPCFSLERAAS